MNHKINSGSLIELCVIIFRSRCGRDTIIFIHNIFVPLPGGGIHILRDVRRIRRVIEEGLYNRISKCNLQIFKNI